MIRFAPAGGLRRLLVLGAHSDDGEIGCGGTVLRLVQDNPALAVRWIVFGGADPVRAREATESARALLKGAKDPEIAVHGFRDSFFPYTGGEIKETFEKLKKDFQPDLILTHYHDDAHQDHRVVSSLTWNTFRDHCILEYEVPKYDGDLWRPNFYVPLSEEISRKKVRHVMESFPSQAKRAAWFTEDTFWAPLRLRGVESNSPSKFSEGFWARKIVL